MLPQKASEKTDGDGVNVDNSDEHGLIRNVVAELEQLLIHANIPVSKK